MYCKYPLDGVYGPVVHTPLLQVCDASHIIKFVPTGHDQRFPALVHGDGIDPTSHFVITS
jgi:hypothetical protein